MKNSLLFAFICLSVILSGNKSAHCQQSSVPVVDKTFNTGAVTITDKGSYYFVTLDYTGKMTPHEMGEQYGRCILQAVPDFESVIGYYLFEIATIEGLWGNTVPDRTHILQKNLDQDSRDELDGLVSVMKGAWSWKPKDEIYAYNFLPDVIRTSQCSAFGCWGDASANGKNIVGRNLDWFGGLFKQELPAIQAITRIRYPDRTIYLFGALGHLGCITGISAKTGILAGVLDSDVEGTLYSAAGCRSFNFDLRRALEKSATMDEIAGSLMDTARKYTFSHLIVLADEKKTTILENNISGAGVHATRALRHDTSGLNPGIEWNHPHMIGAVNGFMLNGQVNNFAQGKHAKINTRRWELLLNKVNQLVKRSAGRLTTIDVREIMTSFHDKEPGSLFLNAGDLYNLQTQQILVYTPGERTVQVYLKPKSGDNPPDALPYFHVISLEP